MKQRGNCSILYTSSSCVFRNVASKKGNIASYSSISCQRLELHIRDATDDYEPIPGSKTMLVSHLPTRNFLDAKSSGNTGRTGDSPFGANMLSNTLLV